MNKTIIKTLSCLLPLLLAVLLVATGCGNKDMFDLVYTFDRVVINLADATIVEGRVENWTDYPESDMVQVKVDGKTYLTHSCNVVLIAE